MPCSDGGPSSSDYVNKISKLEAYLCGILSTLENNNINIFGNIDYKEAGVKRQDLESWWNRHKEADRLRREAEAKKIRDDKFRQDTLAKLSDAEIKALGLRR